MCLRRRLAAPRGGRATFPPHKRSPDGRCAAEEDIESKVTYFPDSPSQFGELPVVRQRQRSQAIRRRGGKG